MTREVTAEGRKVEVVRLSASCGWCQTGQHDDCMPELAYYNTVWLCGCECAKDYKYSGGENKSTDDKVD